MGDRISLQFKNSGRTSVVLFSHWMGQNLLEAAEQYFRELRKNIGARQKENRGAGVFPIDRLEPATVMVDFIRWITSGMDMVDSNLYLGRDETEGDNSDNGHYVLDLATGTIR